MASSNTWIPFNGWSPGSESFGDGWATASNLWPAYHQWRPMRRFNTFAGTVSSFGPMTGCGVHLWASGIGTTGYLPDQATLFCGSKARLFSVDQGNGVFTNVSRAANYGAATQPAGWRFCSVGNDVWATNWMDPLQRRTANTGLFADGVVSTFKPAPRFIAPVREFLVVANLSNAGRFQDEVGWSDADDATNFDPPTGTTTSIAGSKRLISVPGQITGLVGGEYALIFKRRGIYVLQDAGPPAVFRPDLLSSTVGTAFPASIVSSRFGVFFRGGDGFYKIDGLSAPVKISSPAMEEALYNYFTAMVPPAGSATSAGEDMLFPSFQHPYFPLIVWGFSGSWASSVATGSSNYVAFNPETNQWSTGSIQPDLTCVTSLPYAASPYGQWVGFTWSPLASESQYATWAADSAPSNIIQNPTVALRYQPLNFDAATDFQQTSIVTVLPVFSDTAPFTTPALGPIVTVETVVSPFQEGGIRTETRFPADRNPANGAYPFQIAGRLTKITIAGAQEDFQHFHGAWVRQELLT